MDDVVTERTILGTLVRKHPEVIPVFKRYGMGCVDCGLGQLSNIKDVAEESEVDMVDLLKDLNITIRNLG